MCQRRGACLQCVFDALAQQPPVGQVGQHVVVGESVDGAFVVGQAVLKRLKFVQQRADLVAPGNGNGRIEPALGHAVEHGNHRSERMCDGAYLPQPQQAQCEHGRGQRDQGQGARVLVAQHAGLVGGQGTVKLQVDQRLNVFIGALVVLACAGRAFQGLRGVQVAQRGQCGRHGEL